MAFAQKLSQEIVARYVSSLNAHQLHALNVHEFLRGPMQAATVFVYSSETTPAQDEVTLPDLGDAKQAAYDVLGRRKQARLDAFLAGVVLAVPHQQQSLAHSSSSSTASNNSIGIDEGLQGLTLSTKTAKATQQNNGKKATKAPQIAADELTVRIELYLRSLVRSKQLQQDCVLSAEPPRALRARARSIVVAFVDTVDAVQQQSPILTRLLKVLSLELLAVQYLAPDLLAIIRRVVSDYIQSVSFASLAFLSSPETSADAVLTPMILKYLQYLQTHWKNCEADCLLERMLTLTIDPEMRRVFKNMEFRSIGHLLEVCQDFRQELTNIQVTPDRRVEQYVGEASAAAAACGNGDGHIDNQSLRQAIRDLQREIITVNGNVLPPVKSRKELVALLSQVLNSRTLTSLPVKLKSGSKKKKKQKQRVSSESEREYTTGDDSLASLMSLEVDHDSNNKETPAGTERRRRRNFRLSTVDFLTKRLLLAASRTGTGGDAYFIVRDLFGGDDVEVVPSHMITALGRPAARSGSIEIIVRLASVTIKCHGSFDVYPMSLVGEVEPLIQIHTTTTETISLQEVRSSDSSSEHKAKTDEYDDNDDDDDDDEGNGSDTSGRVPVMVVQERITDKTGWRLVQIRPALYEKHEEFSTPS
jgi:hypothetical protein